MNEQGHRLMAMMSTVVDHSHCLQWLVPALRELGDGMTATMPPIAITTPSQRH
jgi:hypothetical protein